MKNRIIGIGFIHHEVREIFQHMKDLEIRIYFSTGRAMDDVQQLINNYPVRLQAIVENGGILMGYGKKGYDDIGDRTDPVKFVHFLKKKGHVVNEDTNQMGRTTEMVLFNNTIPRKTIDKEQKLAASKENIHVSILESQNSYHITGKGIHKGFALTELANRLKLGSYDEIISVGDSELDVKMFIESRKSYLMGNATKGAKKLAPKTTIKLKGKYIDGIRQIYRDIAFFKF